MKVLLEKKTAMTATLLLYVMVLHIENTAEQSINELKVPAAGNCGESATLECVLDRPVFTSRRWDKETGPGTSTYQTIMYNGEVWDTSAGIGKYSEAFENDNAVGKYFFSLIINSFTLEDAARYMCYVDEDSSEETILNFECKAKELKVSISPSRRLVIEADRIYPDTAEFLVETETASGVSVTLSGVITDRTKSDSDPTLYKVRWASTSWLEDGNYQYKITVTTVTTSDPFIGFITVDVPHHPEVSISTYQKVMEAGSTLELFCSANGEADKLHFRNWIHIGPDKMTKIQEYEAELLTNTTSRLLRDNVTYMDSGLYICSACNGVEDIPTGATAAKDEVYIWVKDRPIISNHVSLATGSLDTNITLSVYFVSNDYEEPTVKWYKLDNDTEAIMGDQTIGAQLSISRHYMSVEYYSAKIMHRGYRADLKMHVTEEADFTTYFADIRNSIGHRRVKTELIAKGIPDTPKDVKVISVGDTSISLSWVPGFDGGSVQTFMIEYAGGTEFGVIDIEGGLFQDERVNATIPDLEPNTKYTLTLRARNLFGTSELVSGSILNVTTKAEEKQTECCTNACRISETWTPAVLAGGSVGFYLVGGISVVLLVFLRKLLSGKPAGKDRRESLKIPAPYNDINSTDRGGHVE